MTRRSSLSERLETYFGAHRANDRAEQERGRSLQRVFVGLGLGLTWSLQVFSGAPFRVDAWFVCICFLYAVAAWVYRDRLKQFPESGKALLYVFLVSDPFLVVGILVQDPQRFAFLHPFLLIVIVRTGIRYGLRTMYLAWGSALLASCLILTSPFWRGESELMLAFFSMLALVPVLFHSVIHKVHSARAVEVERTRLEVINRAASARNVFLSKVSHELRSPLQGIISALDLIELRHGRLQEQDADLVSRMRRSSVLLNTQLRDLLTLARGEAGRLEVHPEPFEAGSLVEALLDGARELATSKGLELVADLPAEPIFVVADGARIDQILTNLVINSIRYTDRGQVRVTLLGYDTAGRRLRFSVADTGPGIPEDALPTLLLPDRTLSSDERRGKGSGLGLAIVRTLVELLGGQIGVTSRAGQGTIFALEIPAERVDAADPEAPLGERTNRVLVVDDREDVLEALSSVIDELGFDCDRASSAAVAANLLAARRYDTVLFDLDMPVKSGVEIARETRRGEGLNAKARFIGMSAAEARDLGNEPFDAILTKPLDQAALRQAVTGGAYLARPSQPALWPEKD